jgi:hypothetical protein
MYDASGLQVSFKCVIPAPRDTQVTVAAGAHMDGALVDLAVSGLGGWLALFAVADGTTHQVRRVPHCLSPQPSLSLDLSLQANCRTHRPQKLKCLISLCTNPVSILSFPIQAVR